MQGGPNKVLQAIFFEITADIDLNFFFNLNRTAGLIMC